MVLPVQVLEGEDAVGDVVAGLVDELLVGRAFVPDVARRRFMPLK